jgi:hypothetical protein
VEQHHLIADGDLVAQHVTLRSTHRASTMPLLAGTTASGRSVAWTFVHIWRVTASAFSDCQHPIGRTA